MEEKVQMEYMVVSFSHKNVEIDMRERLSIKESEMLPFLREITHNEAISECILLCTCNRVEFYVSVHDKKRALAHIYQTLSAFKGIDVAHLEQIAVVRLNEYAIYHIFGVASSLDSLVVGETQITGQLKNAYKFAFDNGFCSKDMTRLMHFAFKCAASIRQQTNISSHSVSVASTAVYMAEQTLQKQGKTLAALPVLVVGSGEMGRLVCKHLLNTKAHIMLISRTQSHAKALADELNTKDIHIESWERLEQILNDFAVIFSATSAPKCVISAPMVQERNFPRWWFDLALPRDIESIQHKNVQIFCVDDLQEVVQEHKDARQESAKEAHRILEGFVVEFFTWLQTLSIEPVIKHIRFLAKQSCLKELDRAIKKGFIPSEYRSNVEKILHGAFNTFLHNPTMRLRQASETPQGDPIIEAMKSMFDINDEIVMLNNFKCEKDTTF